MPLIDTEILNCHDCGVEYPYPGRGRRQKRCADCTLEHNRAYGRRWGAENKGRRRAASLRWNQKARSDMLAAYGSECACCGETGEQFLCLDHVNGDGAAQRRELGNAGGGVHFYAYLRERGWPSGFQVLCWNCNSAKGLYGKCPHAETRNETTCPL